MHGGRSRDGNTHPNFKHGRYSKTMSIFHGIFVCPTCRKLYDPVKETEKERKAAARRMERLCAMIYEDARRDVERELTGKPTPPPAGRRPREN